MVMESRTAIRPTEEVAAVYGRSAAPLVGLITVMGGSRPDAEEIVQDAFVRLLQNWPKVRSYDDVDGWLRTVAVRLLISRQRRHRVARLGLQRMASRTAVSVDPASDATDLAAALAELSVDHRAVLLLHHVHDLPVEEVAAILRAPVGTVKSRLARARAAVAPLLLEGTLEGPQP